MVPAGNKAKRLSPVNHTTKTVHHHQFTVFLNFVDCLDKGKQRVFRAVFSTHSAIYDGHF